VAIRAVVFDIGGVLEVNPRTGWQARWAQRLGLTHHAFDERLDPIWGAGAIGALTLDEVESRTGEALGIDGPRVRELMGDAWAEYLGTLNHEMAAYFASLRTRFKTAILSNSFVGARQREQAAYGFEDMCDALVYSHEVGCMKPDARIYRLVCERLEVEPAEAVLLDDVQANVDGARAVGMRAVCFTTASQAIADLEAHGVAPGVVVRRESSRQARHDRGG
jgi:epoxide hydrolase-like predicted phosphatase